jgi:phage-related protein
MNTWSVEVSDDAASELADWPISLRASLARIVERIELVGLERLGEPFVKHLEGKIWEMRPSAKGLEGRALYVTVTGRRVVIVLAFQKKTQRTPRRLIDLAVDRAKELKP